MCSDKALYILIYLYFIFHLPYFSVSNIALFLSNLVRPLPIDKRFDSFY